MPKKKRPPAHTRLINNALDSLEKEYHQARADELGLLHNKFAEAIQELRASPQNVLLVLRVIEWETLESCMKKFFPDRAYVRLEVVEEILSQELEKRGVEVVDKLPGGKKPSTIGGVAV